MNNSNNTWKLALNYFSLSLLLLASVFCVAFLAFPAFAPSKAIKLYKDWGLKAAAVGTSEHKYKKSNKIEDLYNLVVLCDETQNSEKLLKYSNTLLKRSDFDEFASAFDKYALNHTSKDKLYLVASVKNYLYEIRVEYLYKQNREKAFLEAATCFEYDDINLFYFEKYVSCVLLDKTITKSQKTQILSDAANALYGGKSVLLILSERYNEFKTSANLTDLDILRLEQLFELKSIEVVLLEAAESPALADAKEELENISNVLEAKLNND